MTITHGERAVYTHPTLLVNPKYREHGETIAARLLQTGSSPTTLLTECNVPDTANKIARHYAALPVEPVQAPLLVVGGDGTIDLARRALVTPAVEAHTNGTVALSSIGGGFARDHRRESHGDLPRDPAWILKHSTVVPASWIELDIENSQGKKQIEATLYAGIGKTAHGAALASNNRTRHRLGRMLQIGLGAVLDTSTLRANIGDEEPRELSEITIATSGRMSVIGHFPTVLWQDEMHVLTVRPGKLWAALAVARLATGISDGHNYTQPVAMDILTATRIHHDGEPPDELPAGSQVVARLSDKKYLLLTSRRSPRVLHTVHSLVDEMRATA